MVTHLFKKFHVVTEYKLLTVLCLQILQSLLQRGRPQFGKKTGYADIMLFSSAHSWNIQNSTLKQATAVQWLRWLVASLSPQSLYPDQFMWDLWWTNWYWDRFFYKFFVSPVNIPLWLSISSSNSISMTVVGAQGDPCTATIFWHTGNSRLSRSGLTVALPPPTNYNFLQRIHICLWTELDSPLFYYCSMLGWGHVAAKQVGGIASHWFVCAHGLFYISKYCRLLLWYRISALLDDVCWMISLFLNTGRLFNLKKFTLHPFFTVLTACVLTVVSGYLWLSSPPLPQIIDSWLYVHPHLLYSISSPVSLTVTYILESHHSCLVP
jgi:hypothetical protein